MDLDTLFSICSFLVMPCWIALLIIPENPWVKKIITAVILIIAIVYISQLGTFFQEEEGGFGSLQDVMLLFKNESAVLAGWVHYLAFDLFVGRWIATDAFSHKISKWFVAPCLVCTFMFGPLGFLLYSILKYFYPKK